MVQLIEQASKYLMIILFLVYTYECLHVFTCRDAEQGQRNYRVQRGI